MRHPVENLTTSVASGRSRPEHASLCRPVGIVGFLLLAFLMSNLHGREPLGREEVQECLESLVAYQDQFYGKALKVELEVQFGPVAGKQQVKRTERIVADGNDRVRWQTRSTLSDPFGAGGPSKPIKIDYAFDGGLHTKLIEDLNGQPIQGNISCKKRWPPSVHTGDWLLLSIGFHPCDFSQTEGRTIAEHLLSFGIAFRETHPEFGQVVCFATQAPAVGNRLAGGVIQWYLREAPHVHFVGFSVRRPTSSQGDAFDDLYVVEIRYKQQAGYWLPATWEFSMAREYNQEGGRPRELRVHRSCTVKHLELLEEVPAEIFRIGMPADVQIVDDCNPPERRPAKELPNRSL